MITRPYQQEAIENAKFELVVNQSTLIVMATGLGKTFVFCEILRPYNNALIIAHRRELITQARNQCKKQLHRKPFTMMGGRGKNFPPDFNGIVIASVQALQGRDLFPWQPEIIVIDEAHHATANTYRNVLECYPNAKVLGVTATPDRTDQAALGQVFASVAFRYETPQAIADGWLTPIVWDTVQSIEEMITCTKGRPTIIFTPDVETAKGLGFMVPNSGVVYGEMKNKERKDILARFKKNELQYVANCGVLTEGFDMPSLQCVAMYRRTTSRLLAVQCLGRGLRLAPGKTDCLYLDLVGMPEFALEGPDDPLAGRVPWVGW